MTYAPPCSSFNLKVRWTVSGDTFSTELRHVGTPVRLIIWHPFKLIFFKYFSAFSVLAPLIGWQTGNCLPSPPINLALDTITFTVAVYHQMLSSKEICHQLIFQRQGCTLITGLAFTLFNSLVHLHKPYLKM